MADKKKFEKDYRFIRQWPGRPGFNPKWSHNKNFKNGT